ncbi:MAG: DUF6445 family protein [Nannocystaceae bacterium]
MAVSRPQPSLVVVDDVLDDPRAARALGLAADYVLVPGGLRYRDAEVPAALAAELTDKVLHIIGSRYRRRREDVAFRHYLKRDERASRSRGSWVHFDRFRWIGIVYLNLPEQCRGGTSLFTHRATGIDRWPQLYRRMQQQPGYERRVFDDLARMDRWEESLRVSMAFNRLVLFDSRMFHQAPCYFGATLDRARLTLNVFFDEMSDERTLTEG